MNYYEPVQFFKLKPIHVLSRLELSYGDSVSFICDGKEVARLEVPVYEEFYTDYSYTKASGMEFLITNFIIENHIEQYDFDMGGFGPYKPFYAYVEEDEYVAYVFRVKPI